jgi:hypothetical protein
MASSPSLSLELATAFVSQHCERNGVKFYQRRPVSETSIEVVIVGTEYGNYGSIGLTKKGGKLKCYCQNTAKYKWAQLEGFTEEQIYDLFEDEVIQEVSLEEMASIFIRS